MTNPISSNQSSVNTGRSVDADLIYNQYVAYYNDINAKIGDIDKLSWNDNASRWGDIQNNRTKLISLQQQLYPLYQSYYSDSRESLATFQQAAASIVAEITQTYNDAMGLEQSEPPPEVEPPPTNSSPMDTYTDTANNPPDEPVVQVPVVDEPVTIPDTVGTIPLKGTGRSQEADKIYSQYLAYYSEVDAKINGLDQLPYERRLQADVLAARDQLLTLKADLYSVYTAQYNNSKATLESYKDFSAGILAAIALTYNNAFNGTPTAPPVTNPTPPVTPVEPTQPVTPTTPVTPIEPIGESSSAAGRIENGTWYITWTSWDIPIPEGVNMVNIFVGNMHLDAGGNPIIDGFGTLSQDISRMDAFIAGCHAKGIPVKISLGGGGGSYDNCWDIITQSNVKQVAQALDDFCVARNLQGVDFDVENFTSASDRPEQQKLIGTLIKEFKALNPDYQTSLCSNAGFGPNYPWQGIVQNIMDAAVLDDPETGESYCAVDRLYIMAYYDKLSDEQGWVTGWADWLNERYSYTPAQVTVGINSFSGAYDPYEFAAWAGEQGYSTCYWDFNPATPAQSNQVTNGILEAYQGG